MVDLIWTSAAFLALESLPQATAFGIVRQVDYLQQFPEMGSQILRRDQVSNYRQLIYRRTYRTIYRFDKLRNCIYVVNLHNCRQRIPTDRKLDRSLKDEGGLPLE